VDTSGDAGPETGFTLTFSTYIGGQNQEQARDITVDAQGNTYITGGTQSADFPHTIGPAHQGSCDVFVMKFAPDGTLLWARLIGGPNYDRAYAIEIDAQGFIYLGGRAGAGYPTTAGVVQQTFAGGGSGLYGQQDGFITKLSPDGATIIWSTYFGANDAGYFRDIAVDSSGNVYGAYTNATNANPHVTAGAFQTVRPNGTFGLVCKISADGKRVIWASYLGNNDTNTKLATPSIRVDASGRAVVVGHTNSPNCVTTPGAYDRTFNGGQDIHLVKFTADGSGILFGTYLGGSGYDGGDTHNLALDSQGNVIVAAMTTSADFPTTAGVVQGTYGGSGGDFNQLGDGFVSRLSADGKSLLASTYLGGNSGDGLEGVAVDAVGNVFVSGGSHSTNFPTTSDAFQRANHGLADVFVAELSPDLSALRYSTLVGGSRRDLGLCIAIGLDGSVQAAGQTGVQVLFSDPPSPDYPTVNPFAAAPTGLEDVVLLKLESR